MRLNNWQLWRPMRWDALMALIVGAFAILGPDGLLRDCAAALVTVLAACATQLRYWETKLRETEGTDQ